MWGECWKCLIVYLCQVTLELQSDCNRRNRTSPMAMVDVYQATVRLSSDWGDQCRISIRLPRNERLPKGLFSSELIGTLKFLHFMDQMGFRWGSDGQWNGGIRTINCRTKRFRKSFVPSALRRLNTWLSIMSIFRSQERPYLCEETKLFVGYYCAILLCAYASICVNWCTWVVLITTFWHPYCLCLYIIVCLYS